MDGHTCSLKAEWLIDPVAIYFCTKSSGKLCKLGKGAFGTVSLKHKDVIYRTMCASRQDEDQRKYFELQIKSGSCTGLYWQAPCSLAAHIEIGSL